MAPSPSYHEPARRRRAQELTVNDLLQRSVEFDRARPSGRVISEPTGKSKWRDMVLRATGAVAASAALICASQHVSIDFLNKTAAVPHPASVHASNDLAEDEAQPQAAPTPQKSVEPHAAPEPIERVAQHAASVAPAAKSLLATKVTFTPQAKAAPKVAPITLPAFDAARMTLSNDYIEKLKVDEGKRLVSYLDNGKGSTWTIGFGHTGLMPDGRPIGPKMTITEDEAEALLLLDLNEHIGHVTEILGDTPVTQSQFEALVDFSFNKGPEALAESTLLRKLNAGEYVEAADQYLRWTKITRRDEQGNPVLDDRGRRIMDELPGLVRRAQEKRAHMLSAFSPSILDTLDRGMDSVRAAGRTVKRSEDRLRPIQVSGSRHDRIASHLDVAATAIDKHVMQIQSKMDVNERLIERLQGESRELQERYKREFKAAGPHIDAGSDQWRAVADIANQVHVLNRVVALRQADQDRDQRALDQYEAQVESFRIAADALKTGVQAHKGTITDWSEQQLVSDALDRLNIASDRIQELAIDADKDAPGKAVLTDKHADRLTASIDKLSDQIYEKLQDYEESRTRHALSQPRH